MPAGYSNHYNRQMPILLFNMVAFHSSKGKIEHAGHLPGGAIAEQIDQAAVGKFHVWHLADLIWSRSKPARPIIGICAGKLEPSTGLLSSTSAAEWADGHGNGCIDIAGCLADKQGRDKPVHGLQAGATVMAEAQCCPGCWIHWGPTGLNLWEIVYGCRDPA